MDIRLSISVSPHQVSVSLSTPPVEQPADQLVQHASPNAMPLPPEAIYESKDELYASIQAWAARHNYAFRIGRSNKIRNGPRVKIFYNCDRCGPPPSTAHLQNSLQARKRHTTTRKTGCQFSILAIEQRDSQWELRHRPGAEFGIHNHPPSHSTSSHPSHRKLAQADLNQAKYLHNAGK